MLAPKDQSLRQFLLFAFALIVPCFAIWTLVAGPVAMPVVGLADLILTAWLPSLVEALRFEGSDVVLMTPFGELNGRAVAPEQSEYQLGFIINPAIVSYSLPFYATLFFATQKKNYLAGFITGVLILYPLILLGLLSLCMKELMVSLGDLFFNQSDSLVPPGAFVALMYQLNVLIVPTVAPIVVWAWQSRNTELVRGLLKFLAVDKSGQQP